MFEKREFPKRITVELTNRCNLNCTFCPRNLVNMRIGDMDEKLFYKIIDEAAKYLPVSLVIFFRGESLLHPKLTDFIAYAKSKGVGPVQLASNGYLLTSKMGNELIEAGLDFISFSLDTLDEEVYRKTRRCGDLKKSTNNVINFVRKCEEAKLKGIKVPEIQVSTVEVDDYMEGQKEFIDFWRQYADKVRVYIEHSSDGNLGSIDKELLTDFKRKPCRKIYEDMVIYCDGTIALCNHDWENRYDIGNVKNKSIKDIWNSESYENIRRMHENNDIDSKLVCKNCDHWKMYYIGEGYLGRVYEKFNREGR